MAKKTFKDSNPAMAFINAPDTLDTSDAHITPNTPDTHDTHEEQNQALLSSPPRGGKVPRKNMAFSPQNLEYLNLISRIEGVSATEYINRLVGKDMEARRETIEAARKLLKGVGK